VLRQIEGDAARRVVEFPKIILMIPRLPYISFMVSVAAIVYSIITLALILKYFEMTRCPEILFFACFAMSFTFEALRMMIPMREVFYLPIVYGEFAGRVLLCGRFFGLLALFVGSIYAAGLKTKKEGTGLFPVAIVAVFFALNSNVNSQAWDSGLNLLQGNTLVFFLMAAALAFFTLADFLIAAQTKASSHFVFIAAGTAMCYAGRLLLLYSDNLVLFIPGICLLGFGTWIFCSRLHSVYLWM
jgi:hypothetical protein